MPLNELEQADPGQASGRRGGAYWVLRALAISLLALGWQQGALAVLKKMRRLAPFDLYASGSAAHLLGQMNRRADAISMLQATLAAHPGHAATWFNLAYLLEAEGRMHESEPAFRSAVALDSKLDRAWYGLALVLVREERFDEAVHALEHTTRLQPLSPYGWYQLGKLHARCGHDELALKVIRHLRGFEPRVAQRLAQECGLVNALAGRP